MYFLWDELSTLVIQNISSCPHVFILFGEGLQLNFKRKQILKQTKQSLKISLSRNSFSQEVRCKVLSEAESLTTSNSLIRCMQGKSI